jgi:hypothetical protein
MSETATDTSEAGAWLTKQDAGRFLKISYRQVDRLGLPKRRLPGRLTEVWVRGATADDVSDMDETSDGHDEDPDERAVALTERVSDVVRQHTAPLEADLARAREQIEALARENGRLSERLTMTETVADADRQRLSQEIATLEQTAAILAEQANERDALAAQLAESQRQTDRERAAREQAERERDRRWKWRFWE